MCEAQRIINFFLRKKCILVGLAHRSPLSAISLPNPNTDSIGWVNRHSARRFAVPTWFGLSELRHGNKWNRVRITWLMVKDTRTAKMVSPASNDSFTYTGKSARETHFKTHLTHSFRDAVSLWALTGIFQNNMCKGKPWAGAHPGTWLVFLQTSQNESRVLQITFYSITIVVQCKNASNNTGKEITFCISHSKLSDMLPLEWNIWSSFLILAFLCWRFFQSSFLARADG